MVFECAVKGGYLVYELLDALGCQMKKLGSVGEGRHHVIGNAIKFGDDGNC
jgi:hypothetical protein